MNFRITTLLAGLIACTHLSAATLYVSTTGSGTSCTQMEPCPTIQMAADNAAADDTILVAAGTYVENVHLGSPVTPMTHPGVTIRGAGKNNTFVVSAGISSQRPAGVLADIVFDIWSPDVTIEKLSIQHPAGPAPGRDIGVFVSPHGTNVTIRKCDISRHRTGPVLEPTAPGSRGVMVLRAKDTEITKNTFSGNYEDHIHMPTSDAEISKNTITGATRLGIVIIQETGASDNSGNIISKNRVSNSGSDGIQIQGDNNTVSKNSVSDSGGVDIKLCGIAAIGDCVNPFDAWAEASNNTVIKNRVDSIVDNGSANSIH
jgi:parallel beta-helix repeat protein